MEETFLWTVVMHIVQQDHNNHSVLTAGSEPHLSPSFCEPHASESGPLFANTSNCPLAPLASFAPETPLASIAESKSVTCRVFWAQSTGILAAGSGQGHSVPVSTGFSCGQLGPFPTELCREERTQHKPGVQRRKS